MNDKKEYHCISDNCVCCRRILVGLVSQPLLPDVLLPLFLAGNHDRIMSAKLCISFFKALHIYFRTTIECAFFRLRRWQNVQHFSEFLKILFMMHLDTCMYTHAFVFSGLVFVMPVIYCKRERFCI